MGRGCDEGRQKKRESIFRAKQTRRMGIAVERGNERLKPREIDIESGNHSD